jgi:hypothetical protein
MAARDSALKALFSEAPKQEPAKSAREATLVVPPPTDGDMRAAMPRTAANDAAELLERRTG